MGKLDSLKINECPYAFATFAARHNALCDLIAGMVGENGVSVVIAEKNAIIRGNVTGTAGGAIISNTANLVGSGGALANAYVANANIGTYPTAGRWETGAGNITFDATRAAFGAPVRVVTASGNVDIDSTGLSVKTSGGKYCNIAFAAIARDMAVRTIQVCNNNATVSMDGIFSATY